MSGIGMQDQTQATGESGLCVTGQPHKFFYTLDNRKPSASGWFLLWMCMLGTSLKDYLFSAIYNILYILQRKTGFHQSEKKKKKKVVI